ncbi:unnamed protein product [Acanthosepion pharaonis]|uniref:Uncharacterized protein n=1 Tax=Acanthosepion pharaonis TaxID=158019 RepID=A0A812DMB8_ACAPH|nr:unnamed protein product [Sepia pharaonis]
MTRRPGHPVQHRAGCLASTARQGRDRARDERHSGRYSGTASSRARDSCGVVERQPLPVARRYGPPRPARFVIHGNPAAMDGAGNNARRSAARCASRASSFSSRPNSGTCRIAASSNTVPIAQPGSRALPAQAAIRIFPRVRQGPLVICAAPSAQRNSVGGHQQVHFGPLHRDGAAHANANAMFDHQLGEARAVDQDHALRQMADEKSIAGAKKEVVTNTPLVAPKPTGLPTKPCRSHGYRCGRDRGGPRRSRRPRRHRRCAQAQRGALMAAAIAHYDQQIDDRAFEKGRALLQHALEQLRLQRRMEDALRGRRSAPQAWPSRWRQLRRPMPRPAKPARPGIELREGGMGLQRLNRDRAAGWVASSALALFAGDETAAPVDAVAARAGVAGQHLLALRLGEAELIGDRRRRIRYARDACGGEAQHQQHQRLIVGNGHMFPSAQPRSCARPRFGLARRRVRRGCGRAARSPVRHSGPAAPARRETPWRGSRLRAGRAARARGRLRLQGDRRGRRLRLSGTISGFSCRRNRHRERHHATLADRREVRRLRTTVDEIGLSKLVGIMRHELGQKSGSLRRTRKTWFWWMQPGTSSRQTLRPSLSRSPPSFMRMSPSLSRKAVALFSRHGEPLNFVQPQPSSLYVRDAEVGNFNQRDTRRTLLADLNTAFERQRCRRERTGPQSLHRTAFPRSPVSRQIASKRAGQCCLTQFGHEGTVLTLPVCGRGGPSGNPASQRCDVVRPAEQINQPCSRISTPSGGSSDLSRQNDATVMSALHRGCQSSPVAIPVFRLCLLGVWPVPKSATSPLAPNDAIRLPRDRSLFRRLSHNRLFRLVPPVPRPAPDFLQRGHQMAFDRRRDVLRRVEAVLGLGAGVLSQPMSRLSPRASSAARSAAKRPVSPSSVRRRAATRIGAERRHEVLEVRALQQVSLAISGRASAHVVDPHRTVASSAGSASAERKMPVGSRRMVYGSQRCISIRRNALPRPSSNRTLSGTTTAARPPGRQRADDVLDEGQLIGRDAVGDGQVVARRRPARRAERRVAQDQVGALEPRLAAPLGDRVSPGPDDRGRSCGGAGSSAAGGGCQGTFSTPRNASRSWNACWGESSK